MSARFNCRLLPLLLVALCAVPGCQRESTYPSRPIFLICPWGAGGGTDSMSRQIAALLEQQLGVPVNVVNATGGGGVTGHTRGALARPDGYTLTMMTAELNMLHHRGMTNITWQDYEPVMLLNGDSPAIFVRNDAPWQTLLELQGAIPKSSPKLTASGTAIAGSWHLGLVGWLNAVGLSGDAVTWVPSKGAAPSLTELTAGGVDMVCCSVPEGRSLLEAKEIRCLGVMAEKRLAAYPDIPTFRELGIDYSMAGWRGLGVPKGTPQDRIDILVAALEKVVKQEQYQAFMNGQGFNQWVEQPKQFAATLAKLDEQYGETLADKSFRSQNPLLGPSVFPSILGVLFVLVLGMLIAGGQLHAEETPPEISREMLIRAAEVFAWVIVYTLLAETAGFVLTAGVLLTLLLWRFGVRPWQAALIAVLFVPALYQVFAVYLRVPLPRGWLGW